MIPAELARALGAELVASRSVAGGDINRAEQVTLADGRVLFVKHHHAPPPGMFQAEAQGLSWLAQAGALAVPSVVAVGERFLALEWVEPGRPTQLTWQALGEGLAALHRFGAPGFGGPDNYIGTLPQVGGSGADWATFYGEHRLRPQVRLAADQGLLGGLSRRLDRLIAALPERVGPSEPPARLHGDLWGGNLLVAADGHPVLVDPAAYAGHREVDLAMMQLFGGFDPATFAAYDQAWPRAPGHQERVPLYQLYFLLVHVNLFGGGWTARVRAALDALGA